MVPNPALRVFSSSLSTAVSRARRTWKSLSNTKSAKPTCSRFFNSGGGLTRSPVIFSTPNKFGVVRKTCTSSSLPVPSGKSRYISRPMARGFCTRIFFNN